MSGYRRVNYYELCRLCTSSEGTYMHIFREEGRRRQLPTKIQLCLPLQVCEDDSLPKIICNQCADKLESFNEFRNACVNAEAMLEGYFTSLRYSEEFMREGKVYVKDECLTKKKILVEVEKPTIKVPIVSSLPVSVDGINNLVQGASIQIMSQPESEVTRLPQYRTTLETTAGQAVVEAPTVRYTYQTNMTGTNTTTTNVTLLKTEDSTQTEYHKDHLSKTDHDHLCHTHLKMGFSSRNMQCLLPEVGTVDKTHQPIEQGTTTYYVARVSDNVEEGRVNEQADVTEGTQTETLQTISFAPSHGQDVLVHFNFNKDAKDDNNTSNLLSTDDRTSIAQIGEFLRMKNVEMPTVVVEAEPAPISEEDNNCENCGKELDSEEMRSEHMMACPGVSDDKNGGHFACDVCAKPFKRKEHLFQHRKLHTGERPYACVTCGKAFSRKEHLVRHAVSHTGEKVHGCDLCNKSFSRKDNLHKHRKTHGVAGPYVCEVCGKSFVVKHYYLMHKASHSTSDIPDDQLPYRCDICFKGFALKQYLSSHKLRHRGKNSLPADSTSGDQCDENGEEEDIDPLGVSTVNAEAILPPNVIHHGSSTPVYQVSTGTNTTTYMTTTSSNHLMDNYRRLHPS